MATTEVTSEEERQALGEYRGRDVLEWGLELNGTNGLEEAASILPAVLDHGEKVRILVEGRVVRHKIDVIKDSDGVKLVNVIKVELCTVVDEKVGSKQLEKQRKVNQEIADAKAGRQRLQLVEKPIEDDDPDDPEGVEDPF